jgi:hypothetical protein
LPMVLWPMMLLRIVLLPIVMLPMALWPIVLLPTTVTVLELSHPDAQVGGLAAQLLLTFPQLLQSHWGYQRALVTQLIQLPPHGGCFLWSRLDKTQSRMHGSKYTRACVWVWVGRGGSPRLSISLSWSVSQCYLTEGLMLQAVQQMRQSPCLQSTNFLKELDHRLSRQWQAMLTCHVS